MPRFGALRSSSSQEPPPVPSATQFGAHWLDLFERWLRYGPAPVSGPPVPCGARAGAVAPT
eukprot:3595648-Pyramimonas_sp.AAC.1